jgi:hypothetical protein
MNEWQMDDSTAVLNIDETLFFFKNPLTAKFFIFYVEITVM